MIRTAPTELKFHDVAGVFPLLDAWGFQYRVPVTNLPNAKLSHSGAGRQHAGHQVHGRLDFFSRERREGWEQMGNDPDRFEGAA